MVGKCLPPLQSPAFECVCDRDIVIAALLHAIDNIETSLLDGIQHNNPETSPIMYLSSFHYFPSSLFCFFILPNQLS